MRRRSEGHAGVFVSKAGGIRHEDGRARHRRSLKPTELTEADVSVTQARVVVSEDTEFCA